jgi:hypothetical protein
VYSSIVHSFLFVHQKEAEWCVYLCQESRTQVYPRRQRVWSVERMLRSRMCIEYQKATFSVSKAPKKVVSQARKKANHPKTPTSCPLAHNADIKLVKQVYIGSRPRCLCSGMVLRSKRRLLLSPLLREDFPGNGEHSFETLATLGSVLAEPVNGDFLDAVLDLLPAAAHRDNLGRLVENRHAGHVGSSVSDGLLHREELTPGQVLGAHGDGFLARVDVGDFVDEAGVVRAEEGFEPGG